MIAEEMLLDNYCVRLTPTQMVPINFSKYQLGFEKQEKSSIYHDYSLSYLVNNLQNNCDPDNPENDLGDDSTSLTWKLIFKSIKAKINILPSDSVIISVIPDPEYFSLTKLSNAFSKNEKYVFVGWIIQIVPIECKKLLI